MWAYSHFNRYLYRMTLALRNMWGKWKTPIVYEAKYAHVCHHDPSPAWWKQRMFECPEPMGCAWIHDARAWLCLTGTFLFGNWNSYLSEICGLTRLGQVKTKNGKRIPARAMSRRCTWELDKWRESGWESIKRLLLYDDNYSFCLFCSRDNEVLSIIPRRHESQSILVVSFCAEHWRHSPFWQEKRFAKLRSESR